MKEGFAVILIIGAIILTNLGLAFILRRFLGVSTRKAALVWLLALIAGVGAGWIRIHQQEVSTPFRRWTNSSEVETLPTICAGLLASLLVALLAKLHSKWIVCGATDAEKKPGLEGARAWLCASNLVCVLLISLLAWLAFDYSPFGVILLGVLALLAYPAMKSASIHFQAAPPPEPEPNAAERQRVLNMLDSGKITASEGAELLTALSLSEKPRVSRATSSPPQKLALIGGLALIDRVFPAVVHV